MITINVFNFNTRLPLLGRSVQVIFTDTVFGWMRLNQTDDAGMTSLNTHPGFARVYVDGELLAERWLEGKVEILIREGENAEKEKGSIDLLKEARPQVHNMVEEQSDPDNQLTVVLPDQETPPEFLIA